MSGLLSKILENGFSTSAQPSRRGDLPKVGASNAVCAIYGRSGFDSVTPRRLLESLGMQSSSY